MEIISKFSINDTVFAIKNEREKEWIACAACSGTGQVELNDKKPRQCPECYRRKGDYIYKDTKWTICGTLTIGQIAVEIRNIESDGDFDNISHFKDGNTKIKEQYMAYETGVGSGTLHRGSELFATEAEAQKECDIRNDG